MPFTPYHFGPSGFIALVLGRWIDVPVFVLANVIIDVEVLIVNAAVGHWPVHRLAHTLVIGAVIGAFWGICAWPLRGVFGWGMKLFRLGYRSGRLKMMYSGALGAMTHVLIDGIYHYDVMVLWPWRGMGTRGWFGLISRGQVVNFCLLGWFAAVLVYGLVRVRAERHVCR